MSALANSAGGTFIIGIDMKDNLPVSIDSGVQGASKRDWIYKVLSSGTFPAVESVEIRELASTNGTIYVIEVPPSPHAPHQSYDRKYYKRRGSHSEVMEHYEIEDVRNRPKRDLKPLRAELHLDNILAHLRLKTHTNTNRSPTLAAALKQTFSLERDSITRLSERGVRALFPDPSYTLCWVQ